MLPKREINKAWNLVNGGANASRRMETTEKGVDRNDLMATVIPAMVNAGFNINDLRDNAQAIVLVTPLSVSICSCWSSSYDRVGGTDTLATFFAATTYFLGHNPLPHQKLKDELRNTFSSLSDITSASVENLPYLNAVIQESLRIYPPVAIPLPRVSPGEIVDGHYIPKGVSLIFVIECQCIFTDYNIIDWGIN